MKKDRKKENTGSTGRPNIIPSEANIHNELVRSYRRGSDVTYPAKGDRCYCGGRLEAVKISEEHWYRCSECGNDYTFNLDFVDTRQQRLSE